jgi:hypothetical protein
MSLSAQRLISYIAQMESIALYMRGAQSLALDGMTERVKAEASFLIGQM